jgi:hypothetical protein
VILTYYLFRVKKHVCLSRDVKVIGVAWRAMMRIEAGVGDLVQRIKDGQACYTTKCEKPSVSSLV